MAFRYGEGAQAQGVAFLQNCSGKTVFRVFLLIERIRERSDLLTCEIARQPLKRERGLSGSEIHAHKPL